MRQARDCRGEYKMDRNKYNFIELTTQDNANADRSYTGKFDFLGGFRNDKKFRVREPLGGYERAYYFNTVDESEKFLENNQTWILEEGI